MDRFDWKQRHSIWPASFCCLWDILAPNYVYTGCSVERGKQNDQMEWHPLMTFWIWD